MDVFHPLMIRNYMRKYDMDEPPKLDEPIDELDNRMKRIKEHNADDSALEDKYYRYALSERTVSRVLVVTAVTSGCVPGSNL
jgi:chromodomain-helicase-DNA-binding protein 4